MITCRYRFKEIGWTAFRNEYDPVVCKGKSLMAFNFAAPDLDVRYFMGSIREDEISSAEGEHYFGSLEDFVDGLQTETIPL